MMLSISAWKKSLKLSASTEAVSADGSADACFLNNIPFVMLKMVL